MAQTALNAPPVPEGVLTTIRQLIDLSISVFDEAREVGLIIWGNSVREEFDREAFQARFARDLADAKWSLGRFEDEEQPRFYDLLMDEFVLALFPSPSREAPDTIEHTLEVGEILLDSLQKFLEKFAYSALAISVIKEMIKMARAINKRLKA